MTNYGKWDKFDVDSALEETDKADAKADYKTSERNRTKSSLDEQVSHQKKTKDAAEKASLQFAVDSLLASKKLPGLYRHYRNICRTCQSEGLCPHRAEMSEMGQLDGAVESSSSNIFVVEETALKEAEGLGSSEMRLEDGFDDSSSFSDKMMMLSNSLADIIELVQRLQKLTEVENIIPVFQLLFIICFPYLLIHYDIRWVVMKKDT